MFGSDFFEPRSPLAQLVARARNRFSSVYISDLLLGRCAGAGAGAIVGAGAGGSTALQPFTAVACISVLGSRLSGSVAYRSGFRARLLPFVWLAHWDYELLIYGYCDAPHAVPASLQAIPY